MASQVLPVDVLSQRVDDRARRRRAAATSWPVRLGFDRLLGFQQEAAERLVAARDAGPVRRHRGSGAPRALDARALQLLSQGDALRAAHRPSPPGRVGQRRHRHPRHRDAGEHAHARSAGRAAGAQRRRRVAGRLPQPPACRSNNHPLALLREQLAAFSVQPAAVLNGYRSGQLARASGLVTHRQRPETAKGVIFVTLEDETGAVNVIVWPQVAESAAQAAARRDAAHRVRRVAVRGRGAPPDRAQAGRSLGAAAGLECEEPQLPLSLRENQPRLAAVHERLPDSPCRRRADTSG